MSGEDPRDDPRFHHFFRCVVNFALEWGNYPIVIADEAGPRFLVDNNANGNDPNAEQNPEPENVVPNVEEEAAANIQEEVVHEDNEQAPAQGQIDPDHLAHEEDVANLLRSPTREEIEVPPSAAQEPSAPQVICADQDVRIDAPNRDIARLLECPVCYSIMLPPIAMCISGHSICSTCKSYLPSCPVCRGFFTGIRNRFAEQFVGMCVVQCKNSVYGCQVSLRGSELAAHQLECRHEGGMMNAADDRNTSDDSDDNGLYD